MLTGQECCWLRRYTAIFVALICPTSCPGNAPYQDSAFAEFQTVLPAPKSSVRHGYPHSQSADRERLRLCLQASWDLPATNVSFGIEDPGRTANSLRTIEPYHKAVVYFCNRP